MKKASDFADAHLRVFDRPRLPDPGDIRSVYFVGICGTGMGSLAGLFRQAGYDVSGSDANAWPPMSTRLREIGIEVFDGYSADNLDRRPDLVIVGNACTPTHPEAARAREEGMHQLSLPEAFDRFFILGRRSLVVAGTHGKTTTSGLLVHTLKSVGLDPTYLVGGVMLNGETSFGIGDGPYSVVEGDEYDSAYFDKRPKFMHYRPSTAIITSIEFDHADIYDDWDDYRGAFERFAATVPDHGALVLNADSEPAMGLARHASARVLTYGMQRSAHVSAGHIGIGPNGIAFELVVDGTDAGRFLLPMTGRHNLSNALAVAALCLDEDVDVSGIAEAFASFRGLRRRQEILGIVDEVVVIDDFAHHPTAAASTIDGVRERWPERRLVAVFEPRSNSSRRRIFEASYVDAFAGAHVAIFSVPPFRHNDDARDFMDVNRICRQLGERSVEAFAAPDHETLRERLRSDVRPGDVVLIMSNGGFGGLHAWLLDELSTRAL